MEGRRTVETIIAGGRLVTMNPADPFHPDGAVAVEAGRIVAAGARERIEAEFRAATVVDAAGCAILPGLVDGYAHAGHGMIRGLFHPGSAWPSHLYWTHTTAAWWRADAELAALERLMAGVTTGQSVIGATPARADETIYADVTAEAYAESGLRLSLGIGPPDPVFPHLAEPFTANRLKDGGLAPHTFTYADAVANSAAVIRRWHGAAGGRVTAMLAAPYLLGRHVVHRRIPNRMPDAGDAPTILAHAREMTALAAELGIGIHTHLFAGALAYAERHFGRAELDRLLSACRIVWAHSNGIPGEEIALLAPHVARSGIATVAFTHECLWYGFAPIPAFRAAGLPVAITTDGAAPYTSYDLWREMARTAWNQWQLAGTQAVLPPETLLAMVTIEAARVLGLDRDIGSLEPGKQADLIIVDLSAPHYGPVHDLAQSLVHYGTSSDVRDVMVAGEVLMRNRVPRRADRAAILAKARAGAEAALAGVSLAPWRRPGAWDFPTEWPKPAA